MQENMDYMIVNDHVYDELQVYGQKMHLYNYKIADASNFEASVEDIQSSEHCLGLVKIDPEREEIAWIKILYSVSIFMCMVFEFAGGCILFMKLYNDAFEEKERYMILLKLGISRKSLKKSIADELLFAYVAPLLVMSISSYFSVRALGNLMQTSLFSVYLVSVLVIIIFFIFCYLLSLLIYRKNAGI